MEEEEEEEEPDEGADQEWAPRPPLAATPFRGLDALLEVMRQPFPTPLAPVDDIRDTDGIAPWAFDENNLQATAGRAPWVLGNNEEDEEYDEYDYEEDEGTGWEPPVFGWAPVPVDIDALLSGLRSISDDGGDVEEDDSTVEGEDDGAGGIITASEGVPFPWGGGVGGGDREPPDDQRQDGDHDDVD